MERTDPTTPTIEVTGVTMAEACEVTCETTELTGETTAELMGERGPVVTAPPTPARTVLAAPPTGLMTGEAAPTAPPRPCACAPAMRAMAVMNCLVCITKASTKECPRRREAEERNELVESVEDDRD